MDRRTFIAATAATVIAAGPISAKVPLNELSQYFNGIRTLEGKFTQTNADGSRSTGTLYMRRPGRARFEYDPPEKSLVMAGGGQVAVFDGRSNSGRADQYPLRRTPLSIILERNVDLGRRNMVVGHGGDATTTTLVAQDPEAPENGRVELLFQNTPLTLAGWTVIDAQGGRTKVRLTQIKLGGQLPGRLFSIPQEMAARGN
ncbi:MAG: outer membrane lipoprotein carrier protein LolA [Pseudomonadota bacterium]